MAEKVTSTENAARPKHSSSFDWASVTAFVGATVLGLASVVNYVHQTFKNKFIMNTHGGKWTPYKPAYERYWSDNKDLEAIVPKGAPRPFLGKLREASRQYAEQYKHMEMLVKQGIEQPEKLLEISRASMKEDRELAAEFAKECDEIGLKAFGIPYENKLAKWTIGTVRKAQELGREVRSEAIIRFGTVAVVGLGAALALKHSRNVLDDIQQKLDAHDQQTGR